MKQKQGKKLKQRHNEVEQVLERLHLGIHSGDGMGINRLHWIGFVDFIIKNPENPKRQLIHKLISVLCVKERTVLEYINCAIAWEILVFKNGMLYYNKTYNNNNIIKDIPERTDDEILKSRSKDNGIKSKNGFRNL